MWIKILYNLRMWSNGYDFCLPSRRSGFDSQYPLHIIPDGEIGITADFGSVILRSNRSWGIFTIKERCNDEVRNSEQSVFIAGVMSYLRLYLFRYFKVNYTIIT